jgi:hypothetical protein
LSISVSVVLTQKASLGEETGAWYRIRGVKATSIMAKKDLQRRVST